MVGADDHLEAIPDLDAGSDAAAVGARGMPGNARSDEALRWLKEHGDAVWRFAMIRMRSRALAEEVVQETLLAAMRSAAGPASARSERSWLLGIASHKIADHYRASARQRRLSRGATPGELPRESEPAAAPFTADGRWAQVPRPWEEPSESAKRREQLSRLRGCMDTLPPSLDQALWLREVLSLDAAEVCEILGLTAQALWTRLHRARAALRECMERKSAAETPSGKGARR